jgi:hypothetical protein
VVTRNNGASVIWQRVQRVVMTFALFVVPQPSPAKDSFAEVLRFPAADEHPSYSVALSRDVMLTVRRAVDAKGLHMGWDLSANDRRLGINSNFFYECRCGHGPRLHDYYAWHFVEHYFPSERVLPVYGYPLEVRVRCIDCEVAGRSADAHFTRGTVDISLRRLTAANRRQLRLSDLQREVDRK